VKSPWIACTFHIAERTRLRSPSLRKDPRACERVADALAAAPGVREVRARPYTGSVLVAHDPDVTEASLLATAAHALGIVKILAPGEPPPIDPDVPAFSTLARKVVQTMVEIDKDIRRATDGTVDLGTIATLGFVGAGALEVATTGQLPLPPWFNLAWWGFRTFVTTEQKEIQAELGDRG
jgi:hypothetical protein